MRKFMYLFIFAVSFSLLSMSAFSKDEDFTNKKDEELTKEQADLRIKEFQGKIQLLEDQLKQLDNDIDKLKKDIEQAKADLKSCQDAIYALIGATEADVRIFREKLGVIEGKARNFKGMSGEALVEKKDEVNALEAELNDMRGIKISLLPDIYNRIIAVAKDIRDIKAKIDATNVSKKYIVGTWAKDRDCLWNISRKIEIYGDPLLWPKIWQANTDIIRNPDLIHPGDELTIPASGPKSDEEMKAERKYWRKKRTMMNSDGSTEKKD